MKLGIHLANFTFGVPTEQLGSTIARIAISAEDAGFDRLSVMDHYFQIPVVGPVENEMFEAYSTLGFIAAKTSRIKLGVLATGVTYRHPGFLAKQITGLDVLSGGRAWLGIGAAWFEREHLGLGIPFPPLKQRFEMLEETLQICNQMWSDNNGPFIGKHYQLQETLCSPQPIQRPHPPILVAGSGEKKTLKLVARYADSCNIFASNIEDAERLLSILDQHCEREGRDRSAIERTITTRFDPGANGERADQEVERLARFAEVGVQAALGGLVGAEDPRVMEVMATKVIPAVTKL
ncbi:MAG TPA: LLM class F420-dependent oxidoreductase [Tepidiformaceae bacterium]|nr:LLM class F420-dependent oxidoreductase [Tepidiformaceae bacterium]